MLNEFSAKVIEKSTNTKIKKYIKTNPTINIKLTTIAIDQGTSALYIKYVTTTQNTKVEELIKRIETEKSEHEKISKKSYERKYRGSIRKNLLNSLALNEQYKKHRDPNGAVELEEFEDTLLKLETKSLKKEKCQTYEEVYNYCEKNFFEEFLKKIKKSRQK